MKILITTEFYLPFRCGVTTAVLNEKKALEEKGHEVRILTISGEHRSRFEDDVYYIKNNFPQLYKDSYASIAIFDPLLKDIIDWQPDIVHSQCEFFTMAFAKKIARKLDIPLIHTCHTDFDSYRVHFTSNEALWSVLTKTFIPMFMKSANYVICPTSKIYDLLSSYEVTNSMSVIPVGLDLSGLQQSLPEKERTELRESFSFTEDNAVFVSVCRLSEEKNVGESITHFASIHKQRPETRMLIVGDGTERDKLETMVSVMNLSDIVKFSGNIEMDKVWKYYKAGDIFISSSRSEIQGLTYIEALASGLPIVCRKDHALDESLVEGANGYSFSSDREFLEKAIPLVDDRNLRKRIGENASSSVGKYSLENFAESLMKIFVKTRSEIKHRKHNPSRDGGTIS